MRGYLYLQVALHTLEDSARSGNQKDAHQELSIVLEEALNLVRNISIIHQLLSTKLAKDKLERDELYAP